MKLLGWNITRADAAETDEDLLSDPLEFEEDEDPDPMRDWNAVVYSPDEWLLAYGDATQSMYYPLIEPPKDSD